MNRQFIRIKRYLRKFFLKMYHNSFLYDLDWISKFSCGGSIYDPDLDDKIEKRIKRRRLKQIIKTVKEECLK